MKNQLITITPKKTTSHETQDPIDDIKIGDWFWVNHKEWEKSKEVPKNDLFCVEEIGSNYLKFTRHYKSGTEGFRLHFDQFEKDCKREDNWQEHFNDQILKIQKQIKEKTNALIDAGRSLHLIKIGQDQNYDGSLLPSVVSINPNKYKSDLIKFQTETMPELQKEIENLAVEYATVMKDLSLSDMTRLGLAKKALRKVKDRIFIIEIYAGIQESVEQISEGPPAKTDEPISIRQQLLFMDEECLIDFDRGGMDFQKIEDFDKWIVKPENLSRILPEQKGIVAFRVRRNRKDYGPIQNLFEAFRNIQKDFANLETYLLIRNGGNVYRIASQVDFSPRLIPFKDEIGEKQFLKFDSWDHKKEPKKITPDNVRYDDHVEKMDDLIKKYNRIFILIQGLLDRSQVFHPHPGIKLNSQKSIDLWINCIRDEEIGLPNNTITFEEYRDQLNKTLKKGKWVWSNWSPPDIGRYNNWRSNSINYTARERQIINRPEVCMVTGISRARSQVWIAWETESWGWDNKNNTINRHLKIPIKEVFNVSDYTKGDYKMFLCDRALQGKYLEWAPPLITAEKLKMSKFKRGN